MWYLLDAARFGTERDALAALEAEVTWLQIQGWRFEPTSHLCVDADINVAGRDYPVTLRYGLNFPSTPPSVVPRVEERWSDHQYGHGELCLEYGPDNWQLDLTGADMLRSAERLLREQAQQQDPLAQVPSRHLTTVGQDFRGVFVRPVLTEAAQAFWKAARIGDTFSIKYWALHRDNSYVIVPKEVATSVEERWSDPSVPQALELDANKWNGLAFVLPNGTDVPHVTTRSDLFVHLESFGFAVPEGYRPDVIELILVTTASGARRVAYQEGRAGRLRLCRRQDRNHVGQKWRADVRAGR
jgi:ubiquitin-protein ligase